MCSTTCSAISLAAAGASEGGAEDAAEGASPADETVVDAEFEEVDEDKKSKSA